MLSYTHTFKRAIKEKYISYIVAFLMPAVLFVLILWVKGIAPFGEHTNLVSDLYYQYVDIFAWFRNALLSGEDILYSFSISFGNSALGLIAYYLTSPFNLLIVFFKQEELPYFFLLITGIKLSMSGLTMYIFVKERFEHIRESVLILASLGYALMYYNISQATNIMWLDGVYMLPLILLGVYRVLNRKSPILLTVSICLSIIFNWYTAYMNCLFASVYFLLEAALSGGRAIESLRRFLHFILCGITGVLLSGAFFIPVVIAMLQSKASYETSGIFDLSLRGDPLRLICSIIPCIRYDDSNQLLLFFCGTFFAIFMLLFFVSGRVKSREKLIIAVFCGFMLVSSQVYAFENVWNGFRYAASFYCRFGYVFSFSMIFIGLRAYAILMNEENINRPFTIFLLAGIGAAFIVINAFIEKAESIAYFYLISLVLYVIWLYRYKSRYGIVYLSLALILELFVNGAAVFRTGWEKPEQYADYVKAQSEQIALIRSVDDFKEDGNFYRMDETWNRQFSSNGVSAAYNDAMAYGYYGLANYTSTVYGSSVDLVSKLGYYDKGHYIIPYVEPILSSDSLMGIRYVMSQKNVTGYTYVPELSKGLNGKKVYYDPYALPIGFYASESMLNKIENERDPFQYQNELFSNILGRECRIFKPAEYVKQVNEDGVLIKTAETSDGEDIIYLAADTDVSDISVYVDDDFRSTYHGWLTYRTICLGNGSSEHELLFQNVGSMEHIHELVYTLDMALFNEVIAEIREQGFIPETIKGGDIKGSIVSDKDGYLMLTVPYDKGWTAKVNGKSTEILKGSGDFIVLPVTAGENRIEMDYHIVGARLGVLLTFIGASSLAGMMIYRKKSRKPSPAMDFSAHFML